MYKRELDIQEMMALGEPLDTICEELSKKWNISPRTVEGQYYSIVNKMQEGLEERREELRAKLMTRSDYIYKKTLHQGNYKLAMDANRDLAKYGGILDGKEGKKIQVPEINIEERKEPPLKVVGDESTES